MKRIKPIIKVLVIVAMIALCGLGSYSHSVYASTNTSFYGGQLEGTSKTIYNKLRSYYVSHSKKGSCTINLSLGTKYYAASETKAQEKIKDDVYIAANGILRDYPEKMWRYHYPDISYTVKKVKANKYVVTQITVTYSTFSKYEKTSDKKVSLAVTKAVKAIEKTLPKNPTVYDELVAIQKYLKKNSTYSNNCVETRCSVAIFLGSKKIQCQGYARAFKVLCDRFGINCIIVAGETNIKGPHMWNMIKINGKWYGYDAGWNNSSSNAYFLAGKSNSSFVKKHIINSDYLASSYKIKYPSLASKSYKKTSTKKVSIYDCSIKGVSTKTVKSYTGKKITIKGIKVYYKGKKLKVNKDYSVTYKCNKNKGIAWCIIKGKGKYRGQKVIPFVIKS